MRESETTRVTMKKSEGHGETNDDDHHNTDDEHEELQEGSLLDGWWRDHVDAATTNRQSVWEWADRDMANREINLDDPYSGKWIALSWMVSISAT